MNRVLSFPQSHTCDDPAEAVSKRFCFSCIFSVSFISLIIGYLLGSRRPNNLNLIVVKSERDYLEILSGAQFYNKSFNASFENPSADYNEAVMLRDHFKANKFDYVSEIFSKNVSLTFKNESTPDRIEIVGDNGEVHYQSTRNSSYPYVIPTQVDQVNKFISNFSGLPIYGNFGTEGDLDYINEKNISIQNHILILRLGRISIVEKIARAFGRGAKGVLLFADPQQYPQADNSSIHEDLSPILLSQLQKLQEGVPEIAVQVISAVTARNILKDMAVTNRSPDSWHGSLLTAYPTGPGFVDRYWKLRVFSHFIYVRFTTYEVAAYLRGVNEPDRYVVVGNSRKSLHKLEQPTNIRDVLMEISGNLAELKRNKKWVPCRTLIFVSFGVEGVELSPDSWIQKHVDIIKQRTVAYLSIKPPVRGLQLNAEISPVLENLFSNLTYFTSEAINKTHHKEENMPTFFQRRRMRFKHSMGSQLKEKPFGGVNRSVSRKSNEVSDYLALEENIDSTMSLSFGIPTVSFVFKNENNSLIMYGKRIEDNNIQEYKTEVIKLWSYLVFSLVSRKILPFNFTVYISIVKDYHEKISTYRNSYQYSFLKHDLDKFSHSLEHVTALIQSFQEEIQQSRDKNSVATNRIINDKLVQMQRLFMCVLNTYESILRNFNNTKHEVIQSVLNRGEICATEIAYFMRDPFY